MNGQDASNRMFARLYFGVQSVRGGVQPSQIDFARELLDSDSETLTDHVRSRLMKTHGAPAQAVSWLENQPLTDRTSLRQVMQEKISSTPRRLVEFRKTSGSTGAPFQFVKDKEMTAMMDAVMWSVYSWHGIRPGQKHARFWGMPRNRLPKLCKRTADLFLHRRRLDAFELSPESAKRFFLRLRAFRPQYVHAYPNLLLEFIRYCREAELNGHELGVSTVVCGGELLPPPSRQAINNFFGARVVNEYGCSESGLIAIECEYGESHVLPVAVYPQLVDAAEGPDGSLSGEVVITDLYGSILPLIRYRLHDRARVVLDPECSCGRNLPALSPVIGRIDSFIQTPSKGHVYDAILAYSVPAGVTRFRAYQVDPCTLYAEVVLGPGVAPAQMLRDLEQTWGRELGPGMRVRAVRVDEIASMESGKLAYFIPLDETPASVRARAASCFGQAGDDVD